jgi:hypothetical protein
VAAIVVSALAAHTGWDWLLERGAVWWQYPWPLPSAEALTAMAIWVSIVFAAAAGAWGVRRVLARSAENADRAAVSGKPA